MYSIQELEQQTLIDTDQWGRLESELGVDMLQEFAEEFFEETREIWFMPGSNPLELDWTAFKSRAHRSAGAAGTIGFQRLRFAFLCMEHSPNAEAAGVVLKALDPIFQSTRQWVLNRQ